MHLIEEENNQGDLHQKQNNISILTVVSAVCSVRPVEIGSGWAREGERAAKVRAGGGHSHLIFSVAQHFNNSDANP